MEFETVIARAAEFAGVLSESKARIGADEFGWYPHDTIGNVGHFETLLHAERRNIFDRIVGHTIADVGCADGDLGFFCEQRLGCTVDLIDTPDPNFNDLRAARAMAEHLGSSVRIHERDLDEKFTLPREYYDAVFFLGTLYHLRNPYYVLQTLARHTSLCFVSTRIAALAPDHETRLAGLPVAYLLHPNEIAGDCTNYWIFSENGLRRLIDRAGWDVLDFVTVGVNDGTSDPCSPDRDERAFALLLSRHHR